MPKRAGGHARQATAIASSAASAAMRPTTRLALGSHCGRSSAQAPGSNAAVAREGPPPSARRRRTSRIVAFGGAILWAEGQCAAQRFLSVQAGGEHLDGDVAAEFAVVGDEDAPHPAVADLFLDAVALVYPGRVRSSAASAR